MRTELFNFDLPPELIARYPLPQRSASRLLCLDQQSGAVVDRQITDFPDLVSPNDLLVFNNTQVIPARWFGTKTSGGKVELLVERMIGTHQAWVHLKVSKKPQMGSYLQMEHNVRLKILERRGALFLVECLHEQSLSKLLEKYGHTPLPHYMRRDDEALDKSRYQTIYASQPGAVAAPTAGLHFDDALFAQLTARRIEMVFLTLHVGAGTFQPVHADCVEQHQIHAEYLEVSADTCDRIKTAKARGGRIIAVGTTSVRALETASQAGEIAPYAGETQLFIYPGYVFRCVDAMLTNFHFPKSSLLMLVAAFGGFDAVMKSYQHAVANRYRFYSYGDAMWVA